MRNFRFAPEHLTSPPSAEKLCVYGWLPPGLIDFFFPFFFLCRILIDGFDINRCDVVPPPTGGGCRAHQAEEVVGTVVFSAHFVATDCGYGSARENSLSRTVINAVCYFSGLRRLELFSTIFRFVAGRGKRNSAAGEGAPGPQPAGEGPGMYHFMRKPNPTDR